MFLSSDEGRSPSWRSVIVAGLVGYAVNALTPSDAFGIAAFVVVVAILHVTEKRCV